MFDRSKKGDDQRETRYMPFKFYIFGINLPLDRAVGRRSHLPFKIKTVLPAIAGIFLAWMCSADAAYALNGPSVVLSCNSCKTTADFTNAAAGAAVANQSRGAYYVVSLFQASSAFVQVAGHFYMNNGEETWVLVSATPIDAGGNSLAGNSESANESYFASLDQVLFGANRSQPTTVNEPSDYAGSFINSDESEVVPGIGYALIHMDIDPAVFPAGTLITVKFSDGTTAQYIKASAGATYQWTWTGIAHNAKGQLIDRSGNLILNPNTTGTGAGSFSGPGFGAGSGVNFQLIDLGICQFGGTVSFEDGEELTSIGFGPC
jgi:hypothetical protein